MLYYMNAHEKALTKEIYNFIMNGDYSFVNPYYARDKLIETFIKNTRWLIKYSDHKYNFMSSLYYSYMYYYNHFYNTTGNITYHTQLSFLIKKHKPEEIYEFHENLMKILKTEIILISDFKREHFNFLADCYDMEFKRRLIKELQEVKTYYMKIKDSLTNDNLNIIKADYLYIDEITRIK